jgi:hypothetical protein
LKEVFSTVFIFCAPSGSDLTTMSAYGKRGAGSLEKLPVS